MARTMNSSVSHDLTKLAVIAVCFNPVRYKTRYDLYRKFEQYMSQSGVFLFTVECLFESAPVFGLPKQIYEVTRSDNSRHLQLIAPSIIWMKENLINVAVKHLPEHIEYIAWIDTDIEFDHSDWAHLVIDELQRYPIVQLFELAHFLGPNGRSEILRRDYSFAYSIKHNKPIDPRRYKEWYPHPGYAWAMRRTAFNTIGGLCEFSIIGSGDLHFAYALLNRIKETFPMNLNEDYRRLAVGWGERVAQLAQEGHNVGYVPINIWHHWHGSRENRGYVERWGILERYQFAPSKDLEKNTQTGIVALANKRNIGKLQMSIRMIGLERDIVAYFLSRQEDVKSNVAKPIQPMKAAPLVKKHNPAPARTRGQSTINRPIPSPFSANYNRPTHIWTSGPAGSHVDNYDPYWVDCTCTEHHDCSHGGDCPCCIYYTGEHDCCNETENDGQHNWSDNTGYEADHNQHEEHEYHDEDSGAYVSPEAGEADYALAPDANDSSDYGGGEFQGETTDYSGTGAFY